MSKDEEVKQFVETYVMPCFKAAIELLSKSNDPDDLDFVEELKQLI